MKEFDGFSILNHNILWVCNRNLELKHEKKIMANELKDYKQLSKLTIERMRAELEKLYLLTGRTGFSAAFQSHLATDDMK